MNLVRESYDDGEEDLMLATGTSWCPSETDGNMVHDIHEEYMDKLEN
jgi:hypothetical protein